MKKTHKVDAKKLVLMVQQEKKINMLDASGKDV